MAKSTCTQSQNRTDNLLLFQRRYQTWVCFIIWILFHQISNWFAYTSCPHQNPVSGSVVVSICSFSFSRISRRWMQQSIPLPPQNLQFSIFIKINGIILVILNSHCVRPRIKKLTHLLHCNRCVSHFGKLLHTIYYV